MRGSIIPGEIIVVNDGGDPCLEQMLEELEINTKLIYATVKEDIPWNYTGARNLAFWLSTGQYISVEDNDHIPTRDFYKHAIEALGMFPNVEIIRTHKRWVVQENEVLNKPMEDWAIENSRGPHQDCCVIRRDLYLRVKGYDERFAGAYGWSATDWKRRTLRAKAEIFNVGYQYVVFSEPTRGLSSRNYQLARKQDDTQSPKGILNFKYEHKRLLGKK